MELSLVLGGLIGGVLNRFSGFTNISWLPGRNVYYAALALFAISWLWVGPLWGSIIFISFVAYRFPGWFTSLDMGTFGGTVIRDAIVMALRGLFFFPIFFYAYFGGSTWSLVYLLSAAALATLSYLIGNHVLPKITKADPFWLIEFGAGASFGVFVVKSLLEIPLEYS